MHYISLSFLCFEIANLLVRHAGRIFFLSRPLMIFFKGLAKTILVSLISRQKSLACSLGGMSTQWWNFGRFLFERLLRKPRRLEC